MDRFLEVRSVVRRRRIRNVVSKGQNGIALNLLLDEGPETVGSRG
jgi:hypothetical protein